jgi:hypothetical protein
MLFSFRMCLCEVWYIRNLLLPSSSERAKNVYYFLHLQGKRRHILFTLKMETTDSSETPVNITRSYGVISQKTIILV